jgi:flagellar hook-length control protein FliK
VLPEAVAARRRAEAAAATASAQAAESAASASAAWEVVDATENSQSAAQSRAEAAEKDVRNLKANVDDLTRQLETAVQRAQAAESQATEVAAQRDAARQDIEHAAATLTRERREAREAAEQIRQKADHEIASARATCQAQLDSARELVSAAVVRAERAEAALDTERAERRALTEELTAVSAQLTRPRIRTTPRTTARSTNRR